MGEFRRSNHRVRHKNGHEWPKELPVHREPAHPARATITLPTVQGRRYVYKPPQLVVDGVEQGERQR